MPLSSRHRTGNVGVLLFVFLVALLAGCTPEHPQSTFDTSGPVARSQLVLFYWIFWAATIVGVAVGGAILYIVIRYRRRPGDPDPPQIHGHRRLEIGWTILPALVLVVVAVPSVLTIFYNANSPEPSAMEVEVIGHQWWFEFRYPDPNDPEGQIVTANEMHIPSGEVVNIKLDSKDVIHSFWIPKLAGKIDMVPNSPNTMWIEADEPGEYYGQCAEFCAVAHALMRFRVIAAPRPEFDDWLRLQATPASVPEEPLAQEGKALFEGNGECFACHTVEGVRRARGTTGPNLTHLAGRRRIVAGLMENTQANLERWLQDPASLKPGNIMARDARIYTEADMKLTPSEITALVSYLQTLR